ncbi:MAG: potassium transporter TrkA [Firmicutes bacterium HGW-Firmicutes-15]|nr:MAG: potassium transporter TrkA [Firmicutes bacterium HGW-Firmicutes-15]
MHELKRKIILAVILLAAVIIVGMVGYRILSAGEASWTDCAYMTLITIASVGYGEVINFSNVEAGRIFTMFLIICGVGGYLYFISSFTAVIVEGNLLNIFWRDKMQGMIDKLNDHFILCGCGETGIHIIREFISTNRPIVAIDHDMHRLEEMRKEFAGDNIFFIEGDAIHDEILMSAGISKAKGLIACVSEDKDNLVITLSGRQLNEKLRIVSRCKGSKMIDKLRKSGADSVISPNQIGGMRMASEMVRPSAVSFLDIMLRDKDKNLRVEEIPIEEGSRMIGRKLDDIDFWGEVGLFPIAVQNADLSWIYNPTPETRIEANSKLIIIGNSEQRKGVEEIISSKDYGEI